MSTRPKKSFLSLTQDVELALNNSLNEAGILNVISSYGYTQDKLNEGLNLLNHTKDLIARHASIFGEQKDLTKAVVKAQKEAIKAYQKLVQVARAVLNKERLAQLGVTGVMPKSIANFLAKAEIAFNNALTIDDIKNELSNYGFDDKKIQDEYKKIKELERLNERQEAAKGELQQLTKDKEAAIKKLETWFSKFIKIARVAFSDNKQLLEKLGVRVYSNKTKAQRNAPKKAIETRKKNKTLS